MNKPSAYAEVSVIVAGAVEANETYYDETLLRERIHEIEQEQTDHGYRTEVYVLWHEHAPTDDGYCGCIEYVQDGRPTYTFGGEEE